MNENAHRPVILGTAGHIDHGKTSLVRALTGIDADRLPEEKARGMTIDLGFAHLTLAGRRVGVVDVPGHDRFIRNMVAGATGIDLVMLVVAADDGVMPQTREHLEIVELLGITGGLVALNKVDLASDERIRAAESEIRELVKGTALRNAPIVRVSASTGEGIDALKAALASAISSSRLSDWPPLFRLPIDRRFTIQGHGTVVTGSLMGGDARAGMEVELQPAGKRLRVRGVESHNEVHDGIASGRRVALNLAGLKTSEARRGDELAEPGYLRPSRRLAVSLRSLSTAPLEIESRKPFRLHIGTRDVDASFVLLGREALQPGESAPAILETEEPICAARGQRFIVRAPSHGVTVGGGEILYTNPPRIKPKEGVPGWLRALLEGDDAARLLAILDLEPGLGVDAKGLYRESGIDPARAETLLRGLAEAGRIRRAPGHRDSGFWTDAAIEHAKRETLARLKSLIDGAYPRAAADPGSLARAIAPLGPEAFTQSVVESLVAEGRIERGENRYYLAGHRTELKASDRAALDRLLGVYERARFAPPDLAAAAMAAGLSTAKAQPLFEHAVDVGALRVIDAEIALHESVHRDLIARLRAALAGGAGLTVSQLKELMNASRKYAVPICEYLDKRGYTQRRGDVRFAGAKLAESAD